jgi:hypothetical protein
MGHLPACAVDAVGCKCPCPAPEKRGICAYLQFFEAEQVGHCHQVSVGHKVWGMYHSDALLLQVPVRHMILLFLRSSLATLHKLALDLGHVSG